MESPTNPTTATGPHFPSFYQISMVRKSIDSGDLSPKTMTFSMKDAQRIMETIPRVQQGREGEAFNQFQRGLGLGMENDSHSSNSTQLTITSLGCTLNSLIIFFTNNITSLESSVKLGGNLIVQPHGWDMKFENHQQCFGWLKRRTQKKQVGFQET